MKPPLIIFDLDGTFADTALDLIATLNRITAPLGIPKTTMDVVGQIVGQGAKAMITRAFKLHGREINEPELSELFAEFIDDYSAHIADLTRPYPHVLEVMEELTQDGYSFAVCTNKTELLAERLLTQLGVRDRFLAVTGGDTFDFKKPDGRHISETAKFAGFEPKNSIMIGDSFADIDAAKDAGIPSIAVDFGYSDVPAADLKPDYVISNYLELPKIIRQISSQR